MLKKGRAEVQNHILLSDGRKVPRFYRLTDKSDSWKVCDLIIEGVSPVKNYRTPLRKIIAGDSPEKLLGILQDKVNNTQVVGLVLRFATTVTYIWILVRSFINTDTYYSNFFSPPRRRAQSKLIFYLPLILQTDWRTGRMANKNEWEGESNSI